MPLSPCNNYFSFFNPYISVANLHFILIGESFAKPFDLDDAIRFSLSSSSSQRSECCVLRSLCACYLSLIFLSYELLLPCDDAVSIIALAPLAELMSAIESSFACCLVFYFPPLSFLKHKVSVKIYIRPESFSCVLL